MKKKVALFPYKVVYYLMMSNHIAEIDKLNAKIIEIKPNTPSKLRALIVSFADEIALIKDPKSPIDPQLYNLIKYDLNDKLKNHNRFQSFQRKYPELFSFERTALIPTPVYQYLQ